MSLIQDRSDRRITSSKSCTIHGLCRTNLPVRTVAPIIVSILIIFLCKCGTYAGNTYNVYNYDLTSPLFTPDGLIKQVEYASDAASHSSPMIIFPFLIPARSVSSISHDPALLNISNDNVEDNQLALIIASISNKKDECDGSQDVIESKDDSDLNSHLHIRQHGQRRIITVPISSQHSHVSGPSSSSSKIILGLNGILPDCMELVSLARDHLMQALYSSYGIHKLHHTSHSFDGMISSQPFMGTSCSTAYRLAQFIASKCQERAFGGGIRPFGSTIVLIGIDDTLENDSASKGKDMSTMKMCVVDPSGKVTSLHYSSQCDPATDLIFIIGGKDESVRELLRQQARNYISSNIQRSSNIIRLHLEATLWALLSLSSTDNKPLPNNQQQTLDDSVESSDKPRRKRNVLHNRQIEIVLSTAQGGVQYLSDNEVETLLHNMY